MLYTGPRRLVYRVYLGKDVIYMKKYRKKIALILVLALTLAIAIPALAAPTKTVIDGVYEDPDIQVVIPTAGEAVINPYSLPVKVNADDGTTLLGSVTKVSQVATRPLVGVNLSEIDLSVGATVSGTVTGNFKFATSAPSKTSTAKTGLVYLEVKASPDDLSYGVSSDTATTICNGFDGTAVLDALNNWALPAKYSASDKDKVIVNTKAVTKTGMCTIKAGTDSDGDNVIDTPDAGGYFLARLNGNVAQKPKEEWVVADGFTANITWVFEPATTAAP